MLDIFIFVMFLAGLVIILALAFLITILVINVFLSVLQRFILDILPILADLYGRIKYPKEYTRD